jgi:DNA polymerase/3'-5' exonuclease PolX
MTLVLAWSEEEAARYLETFKTFENNNGSIIQRREQTTFVEQITDTLTAIKSVNKTDAIQLLGHCGSLLGIARTPIDQLGLIPGMGPKKVRRVYDAIHKPFSSVTRKEKTENQGEIVSEASESHSDPEKGDSTKKAEGMYNPEKGDSTIQKDIPDNVDQEVSQNSTEATIASN